MSAHAAQTKDCIVLLHGLGRTHHAMFSLEKILTQAGYLVVNQSYPATQFSINTLANQYVQPMVNQCLIHHPDHISFVTHSLGGIVLEKYLETHSVPKLSRIVMLSPPHHGSPLVDLLQNTWLFRMVMGPAGQELGTKRIYEPLPSSIKIGIITGTFSWVPFSTYFFHEKNDGKVSISSAQSPTMTDFITLPVSHTFMMNNKQVQQAILNFLKYGHLTRHNLN